MSRAVCLQRAGGRLRLGLDQNGVVATDLQASYVQQAGRFDYTAVVKQSDGQRVWNCEHITHANLSSAIECARREIARRTPEKHSKP